MEIICCSLFLIDFIDFNLKLFLEVLRNFKEIERMKIWEEYSTNITIKSFDVVVTIMNWSNKMKLFYVKFI